MWQKLGISVAAKPAAPVRSKMMLSESRTVQIPIFRYFLSFAVVVETWNQRAFKIQIHGTNWLGRKARTDFSTLLHHLQVQGNILLEFTIRIFDTKHKMCLDMPICHRKWCQAILAKVHRFNWLTIELGELLYFCRSVLKIKYFSWNSACCYSTNACSVWSNHVECGCSGR